MKTGRLHLRLNEELEQEVKKIAMQRGVSLSHLVTLALEAIVEEERRRLANLEDVPQL